MKSGFVRVPGATTEPDPPEPVPAIPIKIISGDTLPPPPLGDLDLPLPPPKQRTDDFYKAWDRFLAIEPKRAKKTSRAAQKVEEEKEAIKNGETADEGLKTQENAAKSWEQAATECRAKVAANVDECNSGDCWFLAALMAVSAKKELIERLCVARDEKVGVYGFVFYRNGEWTYEVIDDKLFIRVGDDDDLEVVRDWDRDAKEGLRIKYDDNKLKEALQKGGLALYFSHCKSNETWLPLIKKAYAKAHGDYFAIEGGFASEGIEDLTGRVAGEQLSRANEKYLFGGGSKPTGTKGFIGGHAYAVLDKYEDPDSDLKLLKLRNPWVPEAGPVVVVLAQPDDRYYYGLRGRMLYSLHFRIYKADEEERWIVRSLHNSGAETLFTRSVSAEIDNLERGTYDVVLRVTATRSATGMTAKEAIMKYAVNRKEKLLNMLKKNRRLNQQDRERLKKRKARLTEALNAQMKEFHATRSKKMKARRDRRKARKESVAALRKESVSNAETSEGKAEQLTPPEQSQSVPELPKEPETADNTEKGAETVQQPEEEASVAQQDNAKGDIGDIANKIAELEIRTNREPSRDHRNSVSPFGPIVEESSESEWDSPIEPPDDLIDDDFDWDSEIDGPILSSLSSETESFNQRNSSPAS
ncbi:hypothetical protein CBER1_07581 [Cercospora berteroae]|uniref:Calpain catalytic domain-containing protein n=1 Tax=Cercospora berteroae TaxID=357750 RepID=A0A2S6CK21_9PEZI|nr:hypothetical protein CBER1_07581 [Cercospora berteroae]